jgi:hypothetical protein
MLPTPPAIGRTSMLDPAGSAVLAMSAMPAP